MSTTKFETVPEDEAGLIRDLESLMKQKMEKDYRPGATKRGSQPNTLAMLQAEFVVEPDLPDELKVGVFRNPKTYPAWIRVGSSHEKVQSDRKKDIRGFSIKLLDVNGEKYEKAHDEHTQDFITLSMPTMPLGTVKLFREAIYYTVKRSPLLFVLRLLFTGRMGIMKEAGKHKKNQTSPLDIRYWSTTPYMFGEDRAAKYSIVPTSAYKSVLPPTLTDRYLADNMQTHLDKHEASFDFMVQFQNDPAAMPVEDASVEWNEGNAPFIKVATIRIPPQTFGTDERKEWAEEISFSPGQSMNEHRPIGGLNRARVELYGALSEFRHQRDNRRKYEAPPVAQP